MQTEDIDWSIYHIIAYNTAITRDELQKRTDYERSIIEDSLARLCRSHLIAVSGETIRILSLQETLFSCKMKELLGDGPIRCEGGIIKFIEEERQGEKPE